MNLEPPVTTGNLKSSQLDAPGPPGSSPPQPALLRLERQVERGSLFMHSVVGENFIRLGEIEVMLHALIDNLLEKGAVTENDIAAGVTKLRSELGERNDLNGGRIMIRPDSVTREPAGPAYVDCEARMPICHAVCCRLHFALSAHEVESGKVKWDLGKPYIIRHESNGCCTHLVPQSGRCHVYQDRPGVCREYSCAEDSRIWNNFEKMELNHEWIDENLTAPPDPRIVRIMMQPPARPAAPARLTTIEDISAASSGEMNSKTDGAQ